jgi:hypothetical protein
MHCDILVREGRKSKVESIVVTSTVGISGPSQEKAINGLHGDDCAKSFSI